MGKTTFEVDDRPDILEPSDQLAISRAVWHGWSNRTETCVLILESHRYPLFWVGHAGPESYLVNRAAQVWLPALNLPEGSWQLLQPEPAGHTSS